MKNHSARTRWTTASAAAAVLVIASALFAAQIPPPKADKGLIVFYRPAKMKGAALQFNVHHAQNGPVGQLSNGSMLHFYLDPGAHTFWVQTPSLDGQDTIGVDLTAGGTVFVKGEILWGWPTGRPKVSRVGDAQGRADVEKL